MIRKETKLGLAIGGVVLAVIVVWVLAVSGGGDNKQQQQANAGSTSGGAQQTAVQTGTGSEVSSQEQKPAVTLEPIASETGKADTNTGAGATASAADSQNSAKSGDVDWGKLLNGDQPMLAGSSATPVQQPQQQTPAPAGETSAPAAQTATPPAPPQTPAETPKTEPTAASDASNSTAASPAPSQTQTNSANSGSQSTNIASQTTIEPQLTQPANEQVAIANTAAQQQGQSDVLPQAAVAPPQMTTVPPGPSATDSTAAVTSATDSSSAVAASSASGKQRTHVIQKNETLSSISLAAYGSANYYPHILRANPGLDDKRMKVGQTIVLPDVSAVKPSAQDAATGAQNGASGAQVAASAAQIDPAKDYKVVANDSLYRISVKLYGKSDMATKIYELNKQQIGEDPAKLKLGMVLKLPSPPTATQAR